MRSGGTASPHEAGWTVDEPTAVYRPRHPERTVGAYLDCGRLVNGFARIRCRACKGEHLFAFSCQTRNFCPSCQAKRAALFGERLREEIVAPVAHRHVTFTIPRVLRGRSVRGAGAASGGVFLRQENEARGVPSRAKATACSGEV